MRDETSQASIGGYRVGRRLDHNRYLGHLETPHTVELVFLDNVSEAEASSFLTDAIDVAVTERGERVAVREHRSEAAPRLALETPPELASAWDDMRRTLDSYHEDRPQAMTPGATVRDRVTGWAQKLRGKPLVIGLLAGGVVLIGALALWPADAPASTVVSSPLATTGPLEEGSAATDYSTPASQAALTPDSEETLTPEPEETLTPESVVGDMALVALPPRTGAADGTTKTQVAVLERDGSTWRVREVY